MKPYEVVDRLKILYGEKYPTMLNLERVVANEELNDIFVLSSILLGKKHRHTVNALMNLVYERQIDENVFVLFKILNRISQDDDALDALRNFMAVESIDRNNLYLVFRLLTSLYSDHEEFLNNLKNITCDSQKVSGTLFPQFSREQIFILFNMLGEVIDDEEGLSALKNICGQAEFIKAQTELLFRVLMSLPEPTDENYNAVKNIITNDLEPDLFLLFKIIQSIEPDNENIALLKSVTLFKTNIDKLANILIDDDTITIPTNMSKMIKRFEGQALTDSFSRGQLQSKLWLSDVVKQLETTSGLLGSDVYVCAGWYGVLPAILFERNKVENILSFDIDPSTDIVADTLNKEKQIEAKFKAYVADVHDLGVHKHGNKRLPTRHYKYTDAINYEVADSITEINKPSSIINTSCEHIENFQDWFDSIPSGTLVIMQNNNFTEHDDDTVHNTVESLEEWTDMLNVTNLLYSGELELELYTRYMVIGYK
jgi:hypothetical protein